MGPRIDSLSNCILPLTWTHSHILSFYLYLVITWEMGASCASWQDQAYKHLSMWRSEDNLQDPSSSSTTCAQESDSGCQAWRLALLPVKVFHILCPHLNCRREKGRVFPAPLQWCMQQQTDLECDLEDVLLLLQHGAGLKQTLSSLPHSCQL